MAQHHVVESSVGKIDCYQIGDKNLPKVVLVHGWDSNIGSLTSIANALLKANKQVIGLNLPGHAFSKSNSTNLLECRQGLNAVLDFLTSTKMLPLSVIRLDRRWWHTLCPKKRLK